MARISVLSSLFSLLISLFITVEATTIVSSNSVLGVCPAIDGYTYSTVNGTFQISCGVDYYGANIAGSGSKTTFQACINKCAANPSCQSLSWVSNESTCWTKPAIYAPRKSSQNWGVKLISGPGPSGSVTVPASEVIIPAAAIQLRPSIDPSIDPTNLTLIAPVATSNLCYGGSADSNSSVTAPTVTLGVTFNYSSVALDDSSFIATTCYGSILIVAFSTTAAFNEAVNTWPAGSLILITAASSCSTDGQNVYFVATSITFEGLTATAIGSAEALPDIFTNLTVGVGSTSASSKRDLPTRTLYSDEVWVLPSIAPPTSALVASPWGNQYPFYNFNMASTDSRYISESNDLAAMIANGTLIGVTNPTPGIQIYCVNCAASGKMQAKTILEVIPDQLLYGLVELEGSLEVDVAIGVNAFTEYTLSSYEAPIISMGLATAVFTIPNIVTFTPTMDLSLTATFDHSTASTAGQTVYPGQYLAGVSSKWSNFETILDLTAPQDSKFEGASPYPTSSSTYNAYGNVSSYLDASLQFGLSFNINFFNGRIIKNLNVSTSAGFEAYSTFLPTSGTTPNCLGVLWDITTSDSCGVYSSGTLASELFSQDNNGMTPIASGCATRIYTPPSTSSSTSTKSSSSSAITSSSTTSSSLSATATSTSSLPSLSISSSPSVTSVTSSAPACTATSVMSNGNFAANTGNSPRDWYTSGEVLVDAESIPWGETPSGGSGYAVHMIPADFPYSASWTLEQSVTLCPYENYNLAAWLRYDTDGPINTSCNVTACVGNQCSVVMTDTVNPSNPQWIRASLNYKGSASTYSNVQFYVEQCDLYISVADVIMTAVGPTITSTSSSSSSFSSTTSTSSTGLAAVTLAPNIVCPQANGTNYTDPQGLVYTIGCFSDLLGNDMNNTMAPDFLTCINECFSQTEHDCIGVTWVPSRSFATCNFKYDWQPLPTSDANEIVFSAVLVSAPQCSTLSCPANTQQFCESNGQIFKFMCETAYKADPIAGFNFNTFGACIDECSSWNGTQTCTGVDYYSTAYRAAGSGTWPSFNCYLLELATAYQSYLINGAEDNASDNGGWSAITMAMVQADSDPLKRRRGINGVEMGEMKTREVPAIAGRKLAGRGNE